MDFIAIALPIFAAGFILGMMVGQYSEAAKWRLKGNHEYMNRMESGGRLYQVKRETESH